MRRDLLREEKIKKLNKISAYYDVKIRKQELYIDMLAGEPDEKEMQKQGHKSEQAILPSPKLPPVESVTEKVTELVTDTGVLTKRDSPTRAQLIKRILEEARKPLRVMEIKSRLEAAGHKVNGNQPYGTIQNALLRNRDTFHKGVDRRWGLVVWRAEFGDRMEERSNVQGD
jgi:hypothetical protein